ncbi:hypothetical protein Tco_0472365 [Tanacetum coccineum]
MKKKTCKIKTIQKEFVEVGVLKSSTQQSSVNEVFVLNISKEDVESQPNSPPQELINLDPNDQPMWENAKNVAPTPISAIVRPDVDVNFVINSTHLKMISKNKFDELKEEIDEIQLVNDVKNDLKHFKSCIRSMRTIHDKLFDRDNQSKTDLEKLITKFLDGQRVLNMYVKNNVNDIIIKVKQNGKNCQTMYQNMERKIDEWEKSQNTSLEHTDRTEPPPPPQAHTEQVNSVLTGSGKFYDSLKIQ